MRPQIGVFLFLISVSVGASYADKLTSEIPLRPVLLSSKERFSLFQTQLQVVSTTSSLPISVKRRFCVSSSDKVFQMAEPGQKFRETDDGQNETLPYRRLIFAGKTQSECFVCYEKGGFALNTQVAFFRTIDSKARLVWFAVMDGKPRSLKDIRQAYEAKKIFRIAKNQL